MEIEDDGGARFGGGEPERLDADDELTEIVQGGGADGHDHAFTDRHPRSGEPGTIIGEEPGGDGGEDAYRYHSGASALTDDLDGDISIRCVDVVKRLAGVPVLNGLNVAFHDDTITVVLGPSGTGKSVLIKHLIGLMFPDSGDIVVHGESVPRMTLPKLLDLRRRIGVLFQDGALFGSMTVFDNVAFPLRQHTDYSEERISEVVRQRLTDVGLGDAMDEMPSQLSGGMRKRAGFARALVMEPDIVIFDEPDSGLDPVRTALLCELIQEMHSQLGGTYLVVTHDIASARRIGEHIAILWRGRIVEAGSQEQMFSSENQFVRQFLSGAAAGPLGMD